MEPNFHNITHWSEMEKGGHFAAFEQPDCMSARSEKFFRTVRWDASPSCPGLSGIHALRLGRTRTWMAGTRPATPSRRNPATMLTEAKTYDELYRNFRWDIPARFNLAEACCDRHADGTGRLALVYVDENGAITRTSFDEVAEMSRRFANVLKTDGLVARRPRRGVPVAVAGAADRASGRVPIRP